MAPHPRSLLVVAAVALAIFAGAWIGHDLNAVTGVVSSVWPPAGIALALTFLLRRRALAGVFIGGAAYQLTSGGWPVGAAAWAMTLLMISSNPIEAAFGAWLLRRAGLRASLQRLRDVGWLAVAAVAAPAVSATIGVGAITIFGDIPGSAFAGVWGSWWAANVLSDLVLGSLILILSADPPRPRELRRCGRPAALLAAIAATAILGFGGLAAGPYLVFPLLAVAAILYRQRGAVGSIIVVSIVTIGYVVRDAGAFAASAGSLTDQLRAAQLLLATASLTPLLLAALVSERDRANADLRRREGEAATMASAEAALREVATRIAASAPPSEVADLVARRALSLTGAKAARVSVRGASGAAIVAVAGGPIAEADAVQEVVAGGLHWGDIAVCAADSSASAGRLAALAELLGIALVEDEALERLRQQATADPLTGLANHRALHEALLKAVDDAADGSGLALVLFDLDGFKELNEALGHEAGDRILRLVAERIASAAGGSDLVARLGGDEFALLMPGAGIAQARAAAERARAALSATAIPDVAGIAVSAGICDLTLAVGADQLLRYASGALYWAKQHGRDTVVVYAPDVVEELSAAERADRLSRGQARNALRALARAIDARDSSTRSHSDRVAALAVELAGELGWSAERVALLNEAGLIHDVGKIGIPDAILFKPARLTDEEYAVVKEHSALGAAIASEVVSAEQVRWIRAHHERPDGRGYPDGLAGEAIPDGARILAVADSVDVMTSERPYSAPMALEQAVQECRSLAGRQFDPVVVEAFARIAARQLPAGERRSPAA